MERIAARSNCKIACFLMSRANSRIKGTIEKQHCPMLASLTSPSLFQPTVDSLGHLD